MRALFVMAPLALAACGMDENDFVVEYATALCTHTLACSDQAALTFDGIVDAEACYEDVFPDVGAWGAGCRYKATESEACLADMQQLTCPPGDGLLADRPVSCEGVYVDCPAAGTTSDAPAEGSEAAE